MYTARAAFWTVTYSHLNQAIIIQIMNKLCIMDDRLLTKAQTMFLSDY